MTRRPNLGVALAAVSALAGPVGADGPREPGEGERRFEIVGVGDSTVTILTPQAAWLRGGSNGIAVNPKQRDALVARLRVMTRQGDSTVALVTGQTTRLSTDFVAIFRRPDTPLLRRRSFWGGVVTGLLTGVVGAVVVATTR